MLLSQDKVPGVQASVNQKIAEPQFDRLKYKDTSESRRRIAVFKGTRDVDTPFHIKLCNHSLAELEKTQDDEFWEDHKDTPRNHHRLQLCKAWSNVPADTYVTPPFRSNCSPDVILDKFYALRVRLCGEVFGSNYAKHREQTIKGLAIIEEYPDWHGHLLLVRPKNISPERFEALITQFWGRLVPSERTCDVKDIYDRFGLLVYLTKHLNLENELERIQPFETISPRQVKG